MTTTHSPSLQAVADCLAEHEVATGTQTLVKNGQGGFDVYADDAAFVRFYRSMDQVTYVAQGLRVDRRFVSSLAVELPASVHAAFIAALLIEVR